MKPEEVKKENQVTGWGARWHSNPGRPTLATRRKVLSRCCIHCANISKDGDYPVFSVGSEGVLHHDSYYFRLPKEKKKCPKCQICVDQKQNSEASTSRKTPKEDRKKVA